MDFLIKIVTKDLEALSMIVSEQFENNFVVQKVRVRLALETVKESTALPL
jgi:DNA-binding Lrp family transcriptional regulator